MKMDENQNKTENAAPVETQGKKKSKKAPIIIVAVIVAVCFLLPVILGVCAAIFTSTEKWYVSYVTNDDGTCSVGRYVRDPEQGFIRNLVFEKIAEATGGCTFGERIETDVTTYTVPTTSENGDKVTSIGSGGFLDWKELESVVLHNQITAIESEAFKGCSGLKSIQIPASVTSISDNAFSGCSATMKVTYMGTPEQWAEIAIGEGNSVLNNVTFLHP